MRLLPTLNTGSTLGHLNENLPVPVIWEVARRLKHKVLVLFLSLGAHSIRHFHCYRAIKDDEEIDEIVADNPSPENWLPTILEDVCQDIMKVLETLDSLRTSGSLN